MRMPALKLWTKAFLATAAITALAVGATSAMSYALLQRGRRDRGNFLRKHLLRYLDYQKGLGRSLQAVCGLMGQHPAVLGLLAGPEPGPEGPRPPGGRKAFKRLLEEVTRAIGPDLVLVVDRERHAVVARGVAQDTFRPGSQLVVADVLAGRPVAGELLVTNQRVYVTSGAQVVDRTGRLLGAVLLGVDVIRYYRDYQRQSDTRIPKQHRLVLVNEDWQVLASVFPKDKWDHLATVLRPESRKKAWEGRKRIEIIEYAGKPYDFFFVPVRGYLGGDRKVLGKLFILRLRTKDLTLGQVLSWAIPAFLAIAAASILMALAVSFRITSPIRRFIQATEEIAKGSGDLTKRIEIRSQDELGQLARNLNNLFDRLEDLSAQVQRASQEVGTSSAQLSAASHQMLEGAREQALKTESSTAAVTELNASIQKVAEDAMRTTDVARRSGDEVAAAVARMNQIRRSVEEVGQRIARLGESGKRIGKIVEVIRQISDQTSLLALNASIEAAHAGEHGKGFAVVADEVSSLAKRAGQSARDIEQLIATITEQTAEAVRTMEAALNEVEEGTNLVKNTLGGIQKIVEVFQSTAEAVKEQAVASDEIARNMDAVQKIAQEVLASSEEAVVQSERLAALAHHLQESVRGFKVSQEKLEAVRRKALPEASSWDGTNDDG